MSEKQKVELSAEQFKKIWKFITITKAEADQMLIMLREEDYDLIAWHLDDLIRVAKEILDDLRPIAKLLSKKKGD